MNISKRASWFMIVGLVLFIVSLMMYGSMWQLLDESSTIKKVNKECDDGRESRCVINGAAINWLFNKEIVAHLLLSFGIMILTIGVFFWVFEK